MVKIQELDSVSPILTIYQGNREMRTCLQHNYRHQYITCMYMDTLVAQPSVLCVSPMALVLCLPLL